MTRLFHICIPQVYDVDIDKVNKPFLPVASGEMSMKFAWVAARPLPCNCSLQLSADVKFGSVVTCNRLMFT